MKTEHNNYPAWVGQVTIERSRTGSWHVLVTVNSWGRPIADPSFRYSIFFNKCPSVRRDWREYWISGELSQVFAINEALNRAVGLKWVSRKHWIIAKIRGNHLGKRFDLAALKAKYIDKYGENYLFQPDSQDELCQELGLKGWYSESFPSHKVQSARAAIAKAEGGE